MEDTVRALSRGDRISSYEILGLVGVGGMGFVYKARDARLERVVALKLLPPRLTFSEKDRKKLLHEARSASALDHPNIGVIHGIEETTEGQTFIVMAFYEGKTLADTIAAGPVQLRQAIEIFNQIAQGLSDAHSHNVIHRDVKPSNIIITKQGVVKIVDFGLALVLSDPSSTRSLGVPGTAVYMAPE
jgi:serine/threonine-protein kinase